MDSVIVTNDHHMGNSIDKGFNRSKVTLNKIYPCPITGGLKTSMKKNTFIAMCKKSQGKANSGKKITEGFVFVHGKFQRCIDCPTGKTVKKGKLSRPPKDVKWMK